MPTATMWATKQQETGKAATGIWIQLDFIGWEHVLSFSFTFFISLSFSVCDLATNSLPCTKPVTLIYNVAWLLLIFLFLLSSLLFFINFTKPRDVVLNPFVSLSQQIYGPHLASKNFHCPLSFYFNEFCVIGSVCGFFGQSIACWFICRLYDSWISICWVSIVNCWLSVVYNRLSLVELGLLSIKVG